MNRAYSACVLVNPFHGALPHAAMRPGLWPSIAVEVRYAKEGEWWSGGEGIEFVDEGAELVGIGDADHEIVAQ